MAIKRQKRIDLHQFDPAWEGCFILIYTLPEAYVYTFKKEMVVLQSALGKIEDEAKAFEAADAIVTKVRGVLSDNFAGGQIYDIDLKDKRPLVKEDLAEFDSEVLTYISKAVFEGAEKKV